MARVIRGIGAPCRSIACCSLPSHDRMIGPFGRRPQSYFLYSEVMPVDL